MNLYYLLLVAEVFHYYPRLGGKLFTLGFLDVTAVKLVGLLVVIAALILPRPRDAAPRLSRAMVLLFALFATLPVLATVALGYPTPDNSIGFLISFAFLLISTRTLVSTRTRLGNVVRTLVVATTAAGLWCFKQHFGGDDRAIGVLGEPNYQAMSLVLVVPLALWMARYEAGKLLQRTGMMCAVIMMLATLFTESRGGLVALAIVLAPELIYGWRKPKVQLAFLIGLVAMIAFAPSGVWQRFQTIMPSGPAAKPDGSVQVREQVLVAGLNMIRSHPLFGVGLDRFWEVCPNYNPELRGQDVHAVAHNSYVQTGAEAGLPTLGLFLAIMAVALANCGTVQKLPGHESTAALARAMRLAIIGYAAAAFFLTAHYLVTYWLLVFLSQNFREITVADARVVSERPAEETAVPLARARYG